jgi:hypothetical protein
LEAFLPALNTLGVDCATDINELSDADLIGVGMRELHIRRLRDALARYHREMGADERTSMSDPVNGSENTASLDTSAAAAEIAKAVTGVAGLMQSYEWEEYSTADGFLYYHCPGTNATQWLRPYSKSIRSIALRAAEKAAAEAIIEERVASAVSAAVQARERERLEAAPAPAPTVAQQSKAEENIQEPVNEQPVAEEHAEAASRVISQKPVAARFVDKPSPGSTSSSVVSGSPSPSQRSSVIVNAHNPSVWRATWGEVFGPSSDQSAASASADGEAPLARNVESSAPPADSNLSVHTGRRNSRVRAGSISGASEAHMSHGNKHDLSPGRDSQSVLSHTTRYTAADYPEVFENLPSMSESTKDAIVRAYSVANPRKMGYADSRPDVRPAPLMRIGPEQDALHMSLPASATSAPGAQGKSMATWASQLRSHLYSPRSDPNAPQTGDGIKKMWNSGGLAPSEVVPGYSYRHASVMSIYDKQGSVYDRLTDVRGYTGTHRHRFDETTGSGRGLAGKDPQSGIDYSYMLSTVHSDPKMGAMTLPMPFHHGVHGAGNSGKK